MKDTVKELTEGMQRLCAVANRIVAQQGHVSRIEADLLLEDLRGLYDVALRLGGDALPEPAPAPTKVEEEAEPQAEEKMMAMMSTLAAMAPAPEPEKPEEPEVPEKPEEPVIPESQVIPEEPVEEQPLMEELEDNGNALLFDEVVIEPEAVEKQEVPEVPEIPEIPENPESPVVPEEPVVQESAAPEAKAEQPSLLDYLQQPASRTLGESLAEAKPAQSALEKKVDDLRTVININDKFSFMSELFKGNMKAYNDFIMHLNATTLRDEALAHVAEVAAQYKWDEASSAVKTFYKIFDKKF